MFLKTCTRICPVGETFEGVVGVVSLVNYWSGDRGPANPPLQHMREGSGNWANQQCSSEPGLFLGHEGTSRVGMVYMSVTNTCTTEYCSCCFKTVSLSCRHTFLTRYLKVSYKFPSDILEGKGTGYSSDISEETISEGVLGLVPGLGP